MKVAHSSSLVRLVGHRLSYRVTDSFFSTRSLSDSLYERIQIIRDPKVSIVPVLDQWIDERRTVDRQQLQSLVRLMKDFRRFNHALEISQWMTDRRYFRLSPRDVAVRLELISRVHGLEHAENYFNNISNNLKGFNAYGSLLNCYVREKSVEKAEAIMQKMKEMGFATTSFPYNLLINLYSQSGEHDKIDVLMREMETKGIPHDMFTLRNRMSAYVLASDISGMEKVLNQIEEDPHFDVDWKLYSLAASGYLKDGLIEKALEMLKIMEGTMPIQSRKLAFEHLLSLYTRAGCKDNLYRVWNMYKPSYKKLDGSYSIMITCLEKLDDIEGAEKIFKEWESQCTMYDFRVLNRLLVAYCRKGLFDRAELAVKKAVEGRTPYASTWYILAVAYMEDKQMPKAVEMLKKAMSVGRQRWRPNSITLAACLDYLEGQGDVEGIEEFIMLSKNLGSLTRDIYHRLLRIYVAAGKSVSGVLDQMKMDGFTADEETQKIVEMRSSL